MTVFGSFCLSQWRLVKSLESQVHKNIFKKSILPSVTKESFSRVIVFSNERDDLSRGEHVKVSDGWGQGLKQIISGP